MKHWLWYVAAVVLPLACLMPFQGTDIAKLQPVEVLYVDQTVEGVRVETDTGDYGTGADLCMALNDLESGAKGKIFLETADYLMVSPDGALLLPDLGEHLRPACQVCVVLGDVEMENAAKWLSAHEPEVTLRDCQDLRRTVPVCVSEEGRLRYDD